MMDLNEAQRRARDLRERLRQQAVSARNAAGQPGPRKRHARIAEACERDAEAVEVLLRELDSALYRAARARRPQSTEPGYEGYDPEDL